MLLLFWQWQAEKPGFQQAEGPIVASDTSLQITILVLQAV